MSPILTRWHLCHRKAQIHRTMTSGRPSATNLDTRMLWSTWTNALVKSTKTVRTDWPLSIAACQWYSMSTKACVVERWGGPRSKNGVTWPRFVRAASAFCPVFSHKWSVLFSMFDLLPLHHVLNWQVFLHWYLLFYYQLLHYIVQEAQLTNLRDAFGGQSRSPNIVPFCMLGRVSYCATVTLSLTPFLRYSSKMSWPWNWGQRSLKVIESDIIR